jgi:hypothetical protein
MLIHTYINNVKQYRFVLPRAPVPGFSVQPFEEGWETLGKQVGFEANDNA